MACGGGRWDPWAGRHERAKLASWGPARVMKRREGIRFHGSDPIRWLGTRERNVGQKRPVAGRQQAPRPRHASPSLPSSLCQLSRSRIVRCQSPPPDTDRQRARHPMPMVVVQLQISSGDRAPRRPATRPNSLVTTQGLIPHLFSVCYSTDYMVELERTARGWLLASSM